MSTDSKIPIMLVAEASDHGVRRQSCGCCSRWLVLTRHTEPAGCGMRSGGAAGAELTGPWLADVVAALLVRASEMAESAVREQEAPWHAAFDALHLLLIGHLRALQVCSIPPPVRFMQRVHARQGSASMSFMY